MNLSLKKFLFKGQQDARDQFTNEGHLGDFIKKRSKVCNIFFFSTSVEKSKNVEKKHERKKPSYKI